MLPRLGAFLLFVTGQLKQAMGRQIVIQYFHPVLPNGNKDFLDEEAKQSEAKQSKQARDIFAVCAWLFRSVDRERPLLCNYWPLDCSLARLLSCSPSELFLSRATQPYPIPNTSDDSFVLGSCLCICGFVRFGQSSLLCFALLCLPRDRLEWNLTWFIQFRVTAKSVQQKHHSACGKQRRLDRYFWFSLGSVP